MDLDPSFAQLFARTTQNVRRVTQEETEMVFVFGSNLAGIHGAGAAATAVKTHGAVRGVGVGRTGQAYAIPTKDGRLETLPLSTIQLYVDQFREYALAHPREWFYVTRIGCGLAGYLDNQMAPMFLGVPHNCILPREWKNLLRLLAGSYPGDGVTPVRTQYRFIPSAHLESLHGPE